MTATDELRSLLDERGVEWDYGITGSTTTRFSVNGIDLTFTPMRDGLVCSTILTPAQAIAATMGDADLATENARLRELAERAWKAAEMLCQAFDGPCRDDGVTAYKPCPMGERDEECVYGQIQRDLRELGVEVE